MYHTGADLLHEAFFKFTGPIRSEISFDDQFEHVKVFDVGLNCDR